MLSSILQVNAQQGLLLASFEGGVTIIGAFDHSLKTIFINVPWHNESIELSESISEYRKIEGRTDNVALMMWDEFFGFKHLHELVAFYALAENLKG